MVTPAVLIAWPTDEAAAQRQAAAYLPLHGNRTDVLPAPWPQGTATAPFPTPRVVWRELTAWFGRVGPQPMVAVPALTPRWLAEIPPTHTVMHAGIPWLRTQGPALWPAVAVGNLLAMYEAIQQGQESRFVVPAVQDAVAQWLIFQAMRTYLHEAVGRVVKERGMLPSADPAVVEALIQAWRERLGPTAQSPASLSDASPSPFATDDLDLPPAQRRTVR